MTEHDPQQAAPIQPDGTNDEPEPTETEPSTDGTPRSEQRFEGTHLTSGTLPPMALIHLPESNKEDAGPTAQLAHAADMARARSLEILQRWFPGYDFHAAAQTVDDRRFSVLTIGAELFEYLDALTVVEDLVARHGLGNRVRFSHGDRNGQEPHRAFNPFRPNLRRLQLGPIVDALDDQWTTIINHIDLVDPSISNVCEHLERVYGAIVNTNVYLSFGDARGFGPHWDEHDTMIVPVTGTKTWAVYEPTTLSPAAPWVGREVSQRPVWEGSIEPGMCLVIPRGWGHEVRGSDDLAIHYTIGINRMTVRNVLQHIVQEGGFNPLARADVAYDLAAPAVSYERSVHDEPEALTELVADVLSPQFIDRATASYRARIPMRLFPRLFDLWTTAGVGDWDATTLRMPVPAGVQWVARTSDDIALAFNGQLLRVKPAAFDILVALADARVHRFEDLPAPNDDLSLRAQVCTDLARAGLVDVRFSATA